MGFALISVAIIKFLFLLSLYTVTPEQFNAVITLCDFEDRKGLINLLLFIIIDTLLEFIAGILLI